MRTLRLGFLSVSRDLNVFSVPLILDYDLVIVNLGRLINSDVPGSANISIFQNRQYFLRCSFHSNYSLDLEVFFQDLYLSGIALIPVFFLDFHHLLSEQGDQSKAQTCFEKEESSRSP
jgi:hypothetical protein